MWTVWGGFNKPIIPVLQGDAVASEQTEAHTLSTQAHGAKGLSWWRYGVISQWAGVNKPIELTSSPADETSETLQNFADEVVILPTKSGFRSGTYTGKPEFSARQNTWGWDYLYVPTVERTSKVWAEWRDDLPASGLYEIAVFIPNRNATTRRARYKVHGIVGTTAEVVLDINQHRSRNAWVALGVFDLDKNMENAGRVFLNDVTGESDKEIAFDAVRFRRIVTTPPGYSPAPEPPSEPRPTVINGINVADGYDSPVGTSEQRRGERVWPKGWLDATPFGKLYFIGTPSEAYHTGADLNFGRPYEDKGMACYACASGIVTFAARLGKWGNLVVIRHDPLYEPAGRVIYSRYAHVQNMRVTVGERVARGQRICEISDAFGRYVPHLHFDLSATTLLETRPGDWPKLNYNLVDAELHRPARLDHQTSPLASSGHVPLEEPPVAGGALFHHAGIPHFHAHLDGCRQAQEVLRCAARLLEKLRRIRAEGRRHDHVDVRAVFADFHAPHQTKLNDIHADFGINHGS